MKKLILLMIFLALVFAVSFFAAYTHRIKEDMGKLMEQIETSYLLLESNDEVADWQGTNGARVIVIFKGEEGSKDESSDK